MKKIILFLVMLILLLGSVFVILNFGKSENHEGNVVSEGNLNNGEENEKGGNLEEGVFGNGAEDKENNNEQVNESAKKEGGLPDDLETNECGFYFEEYGYCGGKCPDGTCVNEGRSCYCKK